MKLPNGECSYERNLKSHIDWFDNYMDKLKEKIKTYPTKENDQQKELTPEEWLCRNYEKENHYPIGSKTLTHVLRDF